MNVESTQIEILRLEVVILKDMVHMLSYNLRCLNIRQGTQPHELPVRKCTVEDFEGMVDNLVIDEDRRYQDMLAFGADEVAWAK